MAAPARPALGAPFLVPSGLPPGVQRALGYLLDETQIVRLDDLAARAGISKFHLSRLFVRYFGQSPRRLHVELRLRRAEQMLRSGQTGADVAYSLGFSDQAHLSRRFKSRWGLSPRAYLRKQRCP